MVVTQAQAAPAQVEPLAASAEAIERVVREMRFVLANKLEHFSNGRPWSAPSPADKTNGYCAAKVSDWQLRQWISALGGVA